MATELPQAAMKPPDSAACATQPIPADTTPECSSPPSLYYPSASPCTSATASSTSLSSLSLSEQQDFPAADAQDSPTAHDVARRKWQQHLGIELPTKRGPTTPDPSITVPPRAKRQSLPHDYPSPESDVDTRAGSSPNSPTSSVTSVAKDGLTPRAELPPPAWPVQSSSSEDYTDGTFKRTPSWRRKHGSLDALSLGPDINPAVIATHPRRGSENLIPAGNKVVSTSTTTGCYISAPISAPAHYPNISSRRDRSDEHKTPQPPSWARPTQVLPRPEMDIDTSLFQVEREGDEPIEIIQGEHGRIAVRSTTRYYEILVWLPGFSLDNITIATRGQRTVHVVADNWDEADHAQWDIKLGDDADMKSITAKFGGRELSITVARVPTISRSIKTSHSSPAALPQGTVRYHPKHNFETSPPLPTA